MYRVDGGRPTADTFMRSEPPKSYFEPGKGKNLQWGYGCGLFSDQTPPIPKPKTPQYFFKAYLPTCALFINHILMLLSTQWNTDSSHETSMVCLFRIEAPRASQILVCIVYKHNIKLAPPTIYPTRNAQGNGAGSSGTLSHKLHLIVVIMPCLSAVNWGLQYRILLSLQQQFEMLDWLLVIQQSCIRCSRLTTWHHTLSLGFGLEMPAPHWHPVFTMCWISGWGILTYGSQLAVKYRLIKNFPLSILSTLVESAVLSVPGKHSCDVSPCVKKDGGTLGSK